MVDPESVRIRLVEIGKRIDQLRVIRDAGRGRFLQDVPLQAQAERHLQVALQAAIDIAVHIVAEDSSETPEDYGGAFVLLAKLEAIEHDLAERLQRAAGVRNILVHAYLDVDHETLWGHLSRLDDLHAFASGIERYMAA